MKLNRWIAPLVLSIAAMTAPAAQSSAARRIEITVSRFSYSPNQITLKKGQPVVLVLTSTDVTHGLAIKDLNVMTDINKGQKAEVPVTPTKTGTFRGQCNHFCGKGHTSMFLTVKVAQ
jgi:cytochrome c oxidase subunit II